MRHATTRSAQNKEPPSETFVQKALAVVTMVTLLKQHKKIATSITHHIAQDAFVAKQRQPQIQLKHVSVSAVKEVNTACKAHISVVLQGWLTQQSAWHPLDAEKEEESQKKNRK